MLTPGSAPASGLARLAGALFASAALHGVALEALTRLPRSWQAGDWSLSHAGAGRLHARLLAAAPGTTSNPPETPALPPEPPAAEAPEAATPGEQAPASAATNDPGGDAPRSLQPQMERGSADSPSIGLLPAPVYLPANQLDQRPQIKVQVEPAFPPAAAARTGRVVLRLYIGENGDVEKVVVIVADPPGAFEQSAVEAFSAARFVPGMKNGVPVRSMMTIEVNFGAPQRPRPAAPPS